MCDCAEKKVDSPQSTQSPQRFYDVLLGFLCALSVIGGEGVPFFRRVMSTSRPHHRRHPRDLERQSAAEPFVISVMPSPQVVGHP